VVLPVEIIFMDGEEVPEVVKFGFAFTSKHRRTPETTPAGGAFMRNPTGCIRIRITVILGDLLITIDLDIP
jgi:hypothetical protein